MILDKKLAGLLSNFCLDIAKAYFVATFITPSLTGSYGSLEISLVLIRGLLAVIMFLHLSWQFAKLEEKI